VRFSAHAQQRLDSRAISPHARTTRATTSRGAVDQAAAKGARESLLLMDGVALVVSVPNRTVITALGTQARRRTPSLPTSTSAVVVPGSPATPTNTPNTRAGPQAGEARAPRID
jgi:flagellar operon protein